MLRGGGPSRRKGGFPFSRSIGKIPAADGIASFFCYFLSVSTSVDTTVGGALGKKEMFNGVSYCAL